MWPVLKRGGTGCAGSPAQSGRHAPAAKTAAARRRRGSFFEGGGSDPLSTLPHAALIVVLDGEKPAQ